MNSDALEIRIRRMNVSDVERVFMIAWSRKHAPKWTKAAYFSALKPDVMPRRIALVAEDSGEGHAPLVVDWKAPGFVETEHATAAEYDPKSGRVVGFAIASLVPPQAELETIVIAAAEQRRGIGRRLMTAMAEELGAAAVSEALLEVRASNESALGFYRSMGWCKTGRRPRYYAEPEEDAVLMSLALG
jgi:ribosomal-protein-alanine N-acetyltransferase